MPVKIEYVKMVACARVCLSQNIAYTQRMLSGPMSEIEQLCDQLKDMVVTEANAFGRLPLCLLPTVTLSR